MTYTKEIENKDIWEGFLQNHPEANFLQSWYWGEFHKSLGHTIVRSGFFKNEKLAGVMLSVVEPARRGRYVTVAGGPIIDWKDIDLIRAVFDEMREIGKRKKCVFVRVRPQLISDDFSKTIFSEYGFVNAPIHLHAELTLQLDITKTEEDILAQMRKTTRYEIRKALSEKITIETSKDSKDILSFYNLQLETAKRQKFVPFSLKYLQDQFEVFTKENLAILYSAKLENKLLAQAFVIFYRSEAVYHYGASTDEGRKYPGAYLIQWEAIREAKKRGMKRYNFWGVSPLESNSHRFSGLSLFKRGFGGEEVEYLHAKDLVLQKPRYLINLAIENVRRTIRRV